MNFYFSLFQLIETVEGLQHDVEHLASRALRISPRDARANRELLDQCDAKMREVKNLLNNKTHISKITLRKAAILFQILDISYRRMMHLTAATANFTSDDDASVKVIWGFLSQAQAQYQMLVKTLFDLTGIPVTLNLSGANEVASHDLPVVLQKETTYQLETLKHLEKAIEVFGEEQELADKLVIMRKELLEAKKRMKHFAPRPVVEKVAEKAVEVSVPVLAKS
jgi:hypothetical protein